MCTVMQVVAGEMIHSLLLEIQWLKFTLKELVCIIHYLDYEAAVICNCSQNRTALTMKKICWQLQQLQSTACKTQLVPVAMYHGNGKIKVNISLYGDLNVTSLSKQQFVQLYMMILQ